MTIPYDSIEASAGPSSADARPSVRPSPSVLADLVALTKPRITLMVVVTMLGGIWLAAKRAAMTSSPAQLAAAVIGTALVVGSANALNMYLERDTDGLMERTRDRPLPTGRLAVNAVTGLLAALALVSYVAVYTPLKRRSTIALLVGAVPGAIPPLLGWTSVTARVAWPGLLLFGVLFFWQVPHFLAIATFRRDDYARAGLKVLPVERGDRVTRRHIVGYLGALVATSVALCASGVGGHLYLASAIVLGAAFLGFGAWGLRSDAGVRWARGLFATSIVYLVLLFSALMLSP